MNTKLKRRLPAVLLAAILPGLALGSTAQEPNVPDAVPPAERKLAASAAADSLNLLKELGGSGSEKIILKHMDPDGLKGAELGAGMPMHLLRLDVLKKYQPSDEIPVLLGSLHGVLYLPSSKGKVISTLQISRVPPMDVQQPEWKPGPIGRPALAAQIESARATLLKDFKVDARGLSLVQVPALQRNFLMHGQAAESRWTPLADEPEFDFKKGQPMEPRAVLNRLASLAKNVPDDLK